MRTTPNDTNSAPFPSDPEAVLVTQNSPRTTQVVAGLGHEVIPIDVSEIQAADGGLTCMSVLFSTGSP